MRHLWTANKNVSNVYWIRDSTRNDTTNEWFGLIGIYFRRYNPLPPNVRATARSFRPTDRLTDRLVARLLNIITIIIHWVGINTLASNKQPDRLHGMPNVKRSDRLAKSQKSQPNFWKWQPPGRFSNRFLFRVDRAEWGYYPKPPTI